MIDEKLTKFKYELAIAKNLANNRYADREYYHEIISHLNRMILFYEKLKAWKKIDHE